MNAVSSEFQRLVLDDIKTYEGLNHPVKAGLLERIFRRHLPIERIHPNPDDEFTQPKIGPSQTVISNYIQAWRKDVEHNTVPEMEPLYVEKMSVGGYMLLDGHHRWYAAHQMRIGTVPVRVLNVTPVNELLTMIAQSSRRMCVSFDLDEVLLTAQPEYADRKLPLPSRRFTKKAMRKNAPALITELRNTGFDVWVYSSGFMSEDALKKLLRYHGVTVDGIVNGLRNAQSRAALRKAFTEKYDVSVHIDNEGILCVNTRTKEYDSVEVGAGVMDWGAKSFAAVKAHPYVINCLKR